MALKKKMWPSATKSLLQTVMLYAVFVNAGWKAREFNLGTAFAHLRKAEVLADENQAGPVGITNPQGLKWTEKGLKLNALTAVVLRLSQGGAIVAPAVEEKPEFDLSSLEVEPEQGQAQSPAANPETQETAAEANSQNPPSKHRELRANHLPLLDSVSLPFSDLDGW